MHTDTSTPTEVAASRIQAARNILAGALIELEDAHLEDASEAIHKAGTKLVLALDALADARPRRRFRRRGGGS